jgi:hypothetical protein
MHIRKSTYSHLFIRDGDFEGDLCVEDLPSANLENIGQLTLPCKDYIKVIV